MYLPKFSLNKKILSPFRKEHTPSFSIFVRNGRIYFRDYGDGRFRGDVWDLVGMLHGLNYKDSIKKVAEDFQLAEEGISRPKIVYNSPEIIEKQVVLQVKAWPEFRQEHVEWLQSYSLTPDDTIFCEDTRMYPVKQWALNRLKMPLEEGEICWAYELTNSRGTWLKIYRPSRGKKDRWVSNIPFTEIMGLSCLLPCEKLIISKSVKEALILKKHLGLNVIVSQAENICCFTESNIKLINSSCSDVYVSFDSDETGKRVSNELTKLTGWKHINVPDKYLSVGIKDWADVVYEYGVGPVIAHFKRKKIIQ
jgi:hypothetical protein